MATKIGLGKHTYDLWIKARGRGPIHRTMQAPNYETVKKQAYQWLEYGSEVTVTHPSGKVTQFTITS